MAAALRRLRLPLVTVPMPGGRRVSKHRLRAILCLVLPINWRTDWAAPARLCHLPRLYPRLISDEKHSYADALGPQRAAKLY